MNYFLIDNKLSELNYRMYAISYNHDRESKYCLKKQHEQYFFQLLKQLNGQLYEKNKSGALVDKAILFTNSEHLAKVLGCSSRTIRNYNTKLCEAGIIKKIYHGQVSNYEIIFNKYLFPLHDRNNNNICPIYSKENKVHAFASYVQNEYIRKNIPTRKELLEHFNKQLIRKEDENNQNCEQKLTLDSLKEKYSKTFVYSIKDYLRLISDFGYLNAKIELKNMDEAIGNKERAKPLSEKSKEKDVPPAKISKSDNQSQKLLKKIKSEHMLKVLKNANIEELPYVFAYVLYDYALAKIPNWKENAYSDSAGNTIIYIAENYFENCKTREAFDKILINYKKTIDLSSKIIRKKLYSGLWSCYWTFPMTYFSINNKNGFVKAYKYLNDKLAIKQKAIINKQRIELNDKLNLALEQYYSDPNKQNYQEQVEIIRDTIPYREKQFNYCIENKIKKVENYYNQPIKTKKKKTKPCKAYSKYKMWIAFEGQKNNSIRYSFPIFDKKGAEYQFNYMYKNLLLNHLKHDYNYAYFIDVETDKILRKVEKGGLIKSI